MKYRSGTIVYKEGIIFKRTQEKDPKTSRPILIPIASNSTTNNTYFLLLTSETKWYLVHDEAYYLIGEKAFSHIKLKKPSLINLQDIYKENVDEEIEGGLPPRIYREVIEKFKQYQEEHPDELYEELKPLLR